MAAEKPSFQPLYAQIKAAILARIADGEWGPGSFLPSEMALAEEYGVSHGTLRKALNQLTSENRLVRFQGKGTAVAALNADSALFPFFMLYDDNGERVFPASVTEAIRHGLADEQEAAELDIEPGSEVIRIHRIRILNEKPVINEVIVLSAERFPDFSLDLNRLPNTLYEFYYQQYGLFVVKATERLTANLPDAGDQKLLGVPADMPLLEVQRVSFDMVDKPVEFRRSRINTHTHHYRIELK